MNREDSVIRPEVKDEDKDPALRPQYLGEFLGQRALKENLNVFVAAAKGRKEPLDHVFLSGPPGLGKTTLAGIISKELGVDFRQTNAPALDKPKDLVGILSSIPERCVVFIDEIHRLRPAMEEMLYIAMEDYGLDIIIGQGPAARTVRVPIKPFTLIGATTKPGKVSQPLYSRFGIHLRMEYYEPKELLQILYRSSRILGVELEESGAELLATCCRGTPRIANRLLRRLRDFSQVKGKGPINKDLVVSALNRLEVDQSGLEKQDREILRAIMEKFRGGPVGAETLAISVSESIDTLEDFYEPYLIQMGFLQRTPRGRIATALAYQHLGLEELLKEHKDADQRLLF